MFSIESKNISNYVNNNRLQFNNDSNFFHFSPNYLESYIIKNNKCYFDKNLKIDLGIANAYVIDLNNLYYCLYDSKKLLLLDKKEFLTVKTINVLEYYNLGILKISDNIVSTFYKSNNKLIYKTYDVLSNGIKWNLKETKELLEGNVQYCLQSKKYILFLNQVKSNDNYGYTKYEDNSAIFEIKTSK